MRARDSNAAKVRDLDGISNSAPIEAHNLEHGAEEDACQREILEVKKFMPCPKTCAS